MKRIYRLWAGGQLAGRYNSFRELKRAFKTNEKMVGHANWLYPDDPIQSNEWTYTIHQDGLTAQERRPVLLEKKQKKGGE